MVKGKIIKSIAGFYEVHTGSELYRCRARGVFRALGVKPLVGDDVEIEVTDTVSDPMEGNVIRLLPRKNELVRPNVANADQALLIFAITHPAPSYNMLDRFLIEMDRRGLPAVLCFNKQDLATPQEIEELRSTYESCGCRVLFVSVLAPETLSDLKTVIEGKTTVLAGPSGVGKSTLINTICPGAGMETGELSRKISRGKNTTRHVELRFYYPEFHEYEGKCRFGGCVHRKEPGCAVHKALEDGKISRIRYRNYCELYEELKNRRPDYTARKTGRLSK